MKILSG